MDACNDIPPYPNVPHKTISYTGCFGGYAPATDVSMIGRESRSLRQTVVDTFTGGDLTDGWGDAEDAEGWEDEGDWDEGGAVDDQFMDEVLT